ncbi:tryptophan synthase subunit alpha [Corynebacterium guaraldiae]|uniref:Tryptophan synthase alpha chain n=1 Tax=Corynebacterium intestinale TaxID=2943492 RepID=A0ABT0TB70_9CORY|nr:MULTISPECIES: tryptophan synthase subunit alpha [Corynebacterium]MCG7261313.1 tryptophan synthase subunit alpha [Corynebacterium aurimucosum]MCL8494232.1 tryptophan synthase subunit alpha [Corynebacterium intestinale]MCP1390468.1 tryptophan synthase subunit alpha [Corynebacterium intestinale]OFK60989.1 tryptophan synthase subunit alpha [Corynebacterium sp. HMSC078A10]OFL62872.1 tryptophan synthase subunit alpha [Corynebacterium sp. HMSC065D07]
MSRYEKLFSNLAARNEGAFVPFIMLSDPDPDTALDIVRAAVAGGADALELGVPFSDPVADGPTIQASHIRALEGGATVDSAIAQIRQIRAEFPDLPIGMLIYGNVPFTRGLETFYSEFQEAGADSILLPDVPVREGAPFVAAADKAGIDPIFIAPAQASEQTLQGVAQYSRGYIYAISRDGVTGTEKESETRGLVDVVNNVKRFGGAPILLGFGISTPQHVADAISAGAAGAITGSALTKIVDAHLDENNKPTDGLASAVTDFVSKMKAATKRAVG